MFQIHTRHKRSMDRKDWKPLEPVEAHTFSSSELAEYVIAIHKKIDPYETCGYEFRVVEIPEEG